MDGLPITTGLVQCLYCLELFGSVASLAQHKQLMHKWVDEEEPVEGEEEIKRMDIKTEIKEENDCSAPIDYSAILKECEYAGDESWTPKIELNSETEFKRETDASASLHEYWTNEDEFSISHHKIKAQIIQEHNYSKLSSIIAVVENQEVEVRLEEEEEGNATQEEKNREEEVRHEEEEELEEEEGNATQEAFVLEASDASNMSWVIPWVGPIQETVERTADSEVCFAVSCDTESHNDEAALKAREVCNVDQVLHSSDDCIVSLVNHKQFYCDECGKFFKKRGGLSMHTKSHAKVPMKRKRVSRCCVYCGKEQQNLTRHLITKHGGEKEVSSIANSNMSKIERRRAFAKIRNCGILKKNSKRDDDYELIHKSQETASVVHCSVCKGSYSSKYFYRHKRSCTRVAIALKAALVATNEGDAFVKILNRFQDNEVGKMCREDEAIKLLGRHLLQKDRAKVDKTDEVAKSVMSDMRIIARLYGHLKLCLPDNCRTSDASDLLKRENWKYLVIAIDHMTFKNDSQTELKYGLKTAVYYLLIKLADVIIGEKLSAKGQEEEVVEVNLFLKLLKHHQNSFFGDAKYQINKARQEQLRLPARMPLDADMQKLRSYTVDKLSTLSDENLTQSEFVELRNLTCSRITLFNARRGGEVSRMKVGQWTKRNQWIDPTQIEKISEKEKSFFQKMELMYGTGKGNKLVSTLVPKDSIKAMDILTNCDVRIRAGVLIDNHFIFPTLNSHLHVQGWSVTHTVCQQAGLDATLINATTQRGRISTMYAAQDVAPNERALFYTHMGHTAEINEGTYQRPAAIQAVTRVGSYLQEVDKRHVDDNIEERRSEEGSSGLGSMQEESQGGASMPTNNMDEDDMDEESHEESPEEDVTSGCSTEITDPPQPKVRYRWSEEKTKMLRIKFAPYINIPSPSKRLPSKAVVQGFMKENGWANMPYEKIRTKIMNEQRAQQAKMRKQLKFV